MTTPTETMQAVLLQELEALHTRIAATVLGLDEDGLAWQPAPTLWSVHDLIRHAAAEERRWIGEGVANIPAADEGRFAMLALSSGQPVDRSLLELGTVGQVSQLILTNLSPTQWGEERRIGGQIVTVAGCVLRALIELSRILGHVEATAQMWDTRSIVVDSGGNA